MRRTLLALVSALAIAAGIVAATPATAAGHTPHTTYVQFCEDTNGNGDCDDAWDGVRTSQYDLRNDSRNLSGGCDNGAIFSVGWNDCISSYNYIVPPGGCMRIWSGYSQSGTLLAVVTNNGSTDLVSSNVNFGSSTNDTASSVAVGHKINGVCFWYLP